MKVNATSLAMVLIFKALQTGPITVAELIEVTGVHRGTLQRYVQLMRKHKLIYRSGWDIDRYGRRNLPSYSLGTQPDAPRQPACRLEAARRYQQRMRDARLLRVHGHDYV
jgi:hypothetical protein